MTVLYKLCFILFIIIQIFYFSAGISVNVIVDELTVGKPKNYTLNSADLYLIEIQNLSNIIEKVPPRIFVKCEDCNENSPLLVVVSQNKGVLSWELPIVIEQNNYRSLYRNTERTLCPYDVLDNSNSVSIDATNFTNIIHPVILSLSTSNSRNIKVQLVVYLEENFIMDLNNNKSVQVTPSTPAFYLFEFESNNVTSVLLHVTSEDDICLIVSIQNVSCPVFDLEENVGYRGHYQTVTRQGGLTMTKETFPNGFYVVLIVSSEDGYCSSMIVNSDMERTKNVVVSFSKSISLEEYKVAVGVTLSIIILFCTVMFAIFFLSMKRNNINYNQIFKDEVISQEEITASTSASRNVQCQMTSPDSPITPNTQAYTVAKDTLSERTDSSLDETDFDFLNDVESDKNVFSYWHFNMVSPNGQVLFYSCTIRSFGHAQLDVFISIFYLWLSQALLIFIFFYYPDIILRERLFRNQSFNIKKLTNRMKNLLYLSDLARKNQSILKKKSELYFWNLLTVGIFYFLPVFQLVFTDQFRLNQSGKTDICYYNFLCSHPLWWFSDFNHMFSNIGYISFGVLFMFLTALKEKDYKKKVSFDKRLCKYYGIPQHFGIFYALGTALIIEGVLSLCYHICPNHYNFQFDTSFMYVICTLCMIKIYQTRHPDINANAYATFSLLAGVIVLGMYGVLSNNLLFWILFTTVHFSICVYLSLQIYYMGRFKLKFRSILRWCNELQPCCSCHLQFFRPMFPTRFALLAVANVCNWGLAAGSFIYEIHNFSSYLLTIFMVNLVLYTSFYILMKFICKEKLLLQSVIYILLSMLCWSAALYFFFSKTISWKLAPAESKLYNQKCKLFDFYDNHDIWHFISAAAMFFSFMVLLTLDDDLIGVHRSKIVVF